MLSELKTLQTAFFDYLFKEERGYVCISTRKGNDRSTFRDHYFDWPEQKNDMFAFITSAEKSLNVWFGIHLLVTGKRLSENCLPTNYLWADLDSCDPTTITPQPQCVIESSPGRYQAVWVLDEHLDPYVASQYSKRIAYAYKKDGADPSGWDLTQLLRVPFTYNYKYDDGETTLPQVQLQSAIDHPLPVALFDELPEAPKSATEAEQIDVPTELEDPADLILRFWPGLRRTPFTTLYETEPEDDWSGPLWRLNNVCFEAGMDETQVFSVLQSAKCNKYVRDNRPLSHLWREVLRAKAAQQNIQAIVGSYEYISMPVLVTKDELDILPRTIIDDYKDWACAATDASAQYHELSIFVLLSILTASGLKLETSYGEFTPNLWGLILGDSTLTRKTTAMKLAMSFVDEIDRDLILATDGSAEGILTGLSTRPSMVSTYFKDEVAGFLDSIAKKEYLAGLPEILTQLHDVPPIYTRRLRKETITISSPIFIFFGGGIRDKVYSLVNEQLILSGFIPRFLIVSGETDLSQIRTTGPPTQAGKEGRAGIKEQLSSLYTSYNRTAPIEVAGQRTMINAKAEVFLTTEAWTRYQAIEMQMIEAANNSAMSHLALPCFERLSRSLLKMTMLVAASRQEPEVETVTAEVTDVLIAGKYIQQWGNYTVDLILNSGRSQAQRVIEAVLNAIKRQPGISRGKIMQHYHLTAREMTEIENTMVDRGQLVTEKVGKATLYKAVI
jgi:hypothetical protein